MAEFWYQIGDEKSEIFSDVSYAYKRMENNNSSLSKIFYATGDDIEFNELFELDFVIRPYIIIQGSKLADTIQFEKIPSKLIFEDVIFNKVIFNSKLHCNKLCFERCEIVELVLKDFSEVNCLEIKNCKIKSITLVDIHINIFNLSNSLINQFSYHSTKLIEGFTQLKGLDYCKIKTLNINNSYLNADFKTIEFTEPLYFGNNGDIKINFEGCLFNCSAINIIKNKIISFYITESKFQVFKNFTTKENNGEIIFSNCFFESELEFKDITAKNIKESISFNFIDTLFREILFLNERIIESLKFKNTLFLKDIFLPTKIYELNQKMKIINSSIWCIKKNQALEKNDKITALHYRELEMISYAREMRKAKSNLEDRILLFLNNISNSHGLSWKRGIFFTLFSWISFFTLYIWSLWGNQINTDCTIIFNYKEYWFNAFNFLWLPSTDFNSLSLDQIKSLSLINIFLVFTAFIFGKIMIGYGLYQTISAFRKHGKM